MRSETVEKIIELNERIEEIESFVFLASRDGYWEKILFDKKVKLITNTHGFHKKTGGLRLDKELTLKILDVLEEEKNRLHKELDKLIKLEELTK